MSAVNNSSKPPLRDRLIPWYFVMAFAVVFVVNMLFIYMATQTHRGVITQNAYEKGLNYDQIVEQTRKQKQESN